MKLFAVVFGLSVLNFLSVLGSDRVADAYVIIHVTDDQGLPVDDARVDVSFDMCGLGYNTRSTVNTDSNGVCRVTGRTAGVIELEVKKNEFYTAKSEICLIEMGKKHEIKWGKWQPWELEKKIVLPMVRNPMAKLSATGDGWKTTKQYNQWIGFDLVKYDYVAPYGKGEYADFELFFKWDGKSYQHYKGSSQTIRFVEKFAGAYWSDKFSGSKLRGIYHADESAEFMKDFHFYEWKHCNEKGKFIRWNRSLCDKNKVLVGRSRCKVNEAGELQSAMYFQIVNLSFSHDEKGVSIRCVSYYNPIPNDTNIEPML